MYPGSIRTPVPRAGKIHRRDVPGPESKYNETCSQCVNRDDGDLDTGNYRKRVLKQLADTLNLPNLTFQIIRRMIATLSQTKGHVKATQGLLRHSRMPTATDMFQQVIPEGVEEMVDSIHGELWRPGAAAAETSKIAANLRAKKQRRSVRKNAKLAPNRLRPAPKGLV